MSLVLIVWSLLFSVSLGFPSIYYLYMKYHAKKPWKIKLDEAYRPSISILVPMYNEEKTIRFKLENLYKVDYPADKVEIILVNDASTDKTLDEVYKFIESHQGLKIKVLNRTGRSGKSGSLNFALKHAAGEVIVVSDADCFWPSNILVNALPYLFDSNIGAVTGREYLLNSNSSLVTKGEIFYDNFVQTIRVGESKVHSTIPFQGGFAAYKREFLKEFDLETDDSGTALRIVQEHGRTLIIPEAPFYTTFPVTWKNRIAIKMRRAKQLQGIWVRCLKLLFQGKLRLAKRIAVPEIFLHILNPIFFVAFMLATLFLIMEQPFLIPVFAAILLLILAVPKGRIGLIETVQNNCILVAAMALFFINKKPEPWKTVEESRSLLDESILKEKCLI